MTRLRKLIQFYKSFESVRGCVQQEVLRYGGIEHRLSFWFIGQHLNNLPGDINTDYRHIAKPWPLCASLTTIMTKGEIIAGVIGGIITSIAIPFTTYFFVRLLNKCLIRISLDAPRDESDYRVYNLRVRNCSLVTLKNVIAYISVDNDKNDIIPTSESGFAIFNETTKVENSFLSWSKNVANGNSSQIEINQGEIPDLNLIRYHINKPHKGIEIASEHGFSGGTNKARTLLKSNRNYIVEIKITGENFYPKKRKYIFSPATGQLTKK
jgi:hypothetical protein